MPRQSHASYTTCARKPDGFWNLKTSLPATRRYRTVSHCAQSCFEFSWHGNVSVLIMFYICQNSYFVLKTVRYFWRTLYILSFYLITTVVVASTSIVTRLQAGLPGLNPGHGQWRDFFSSPPRPYWLWDPPTTQPRTQWVSRVSFLVLRGRGV